MHLKKRHEGNTVVLTVEANRIDAANAVYLKDAFAEAIAREDAAILMDLKNVNFMDSSGLGAMVAAMKQLDGKKKLALCHLSPAVDKVFKLTRMFTVFDIYPSLEDALSSTSRPQDASAA
jgi:anti-sigma B factor antagonist